MADRQYSLLMAAMVAMVAVVGLVVHFSGVTGAYNVALWNAPTNVPHGYQYPVGVDQAHYDYGYDTMARSCVHSGEEASRCCSYRCQDYCEDKNYRISGQTVTECIEQCARGCHMGSKDLLLTS